MVAGLKSCGLASFAFVGINAQETGPHIATQWTLVISPATRPCKGRVSIVNCLVIKHLVYLGLVAGVH